MSLCLDESLRVKAVPSVKGLKLPLDGVLPSDLPFRPSALTKVREPIVGAIGRPPKPLTERFLEQVHVDPTTECWNWTGSTPAGYGKICADGVWIAAHRLAYELWVGPIPAGLHIDHLCRNRGCVRVDHLEAVTPAENVRRGMSPPGIGHRMMACRRGHPFDEANTRTAQAKQRLCRVCQAIRELRVADRLKAERAARGLRNVHYVEAFGERKSIAAWARDERCTVSESTLRQRFKPGADAERAIISPLGHGPLRVTNVVPRSAVSREPIAR
jgi:hypothetical protein